MGYNRENYKRIRQEYEGKNLRAKEAAEARRLELHEKIPDVKQIDAELERTGLAVLSLATRFHGEALERELAKLKKKNDSLLADRAACLTYHGYPADYSDVKYECPLCQDTGFDGLTLCRCMKEKLTRAGYESSGIGKLIAEKTFENYDPEAQRQDPRALSNNKMVYGLCKKYAEEFGESGNDNLLFIGGTGLGKTHLSAAIAGRIIERGFDVVCETAQNLFSDFEYEKFGRAYGSADGGDSRTLRYFFADLLIIDDLGTELTNQFTVSCLYNVINTRLNRGLAMIINTNLTRDELNRRYADRITSRLFGEFLPLMFLGKDMREKMLEKPVRTPGTRGKKG